MKKLILLTCWLLCLAARAYCTVWTVGNVSNTFSPATITITYGDSVNFNITNAHDAREVSQTTWNANGSTALPGGFQVAFGGGILLPAQLAVGTHYYVCTPHASLGMKGTIIVQNCTNPSTPGTIAGNASPCAGTANTYSIAAVSGATSYTWTLPGAWTGTSTSTSISTVASATSGNITVVANNFCGSSAARTLAVTVTSTPSTPGVISGNALVCMGSSNTYSITAVPGATSYTWALPSGWTGTSTTNSITSTASASSGNITVTASNSCGASPAQTLAVTSAATPATPGTIGGSSTICAGTSNTYTVTAVPGATSYTWTLPVGWTGSSTTNTITANSNTTSGNITVTASNTCGTSAAQTFAVTVSSAPGTPGSILGNASVCAGSANSYSIPTVLGATSYTWTLPGGWSGTSTTNTIATTASTSSGSISVVANNACGSSSAQTLPVTVSATPTAPGTISGNITACAGSTNTYTITTVPGATAYTWTLPNGWTGTSTTNSITATTSTSSGNVTVTANNACGSSAPQSLTVTVNTTPAMPGTITGNAAICVGSSNTYSIAPVGGATAYTWSLPLGWTGSSSTNTIATTASLSSGSITVSANNSCGSSPTQTLVVTVSATPATPGTITGNASVCAGSANAYSIPSVPGATSYAWTLPGGWSGTSTTNSIAATASSTSGNIAVVASNACGTSAPQTLTVAVNNPPAAPGTISGNSAVCAGSSNTYSITAVPGATAYTWALPSAWTGSSTTISIGSVASTTSGNITVSAVNACGSSTVQTLAVAVSAAPPATPGTITGNTSICTSSLNTYSITAVSGATSYTWTLPGGWSGTSTTTSIAAVASASSGTITVTANNACGSSAPRTLAVTVSGSVALPQPGAITGNTPICSGSVNTYSITAVGGATSYVWTLPGGWSGTSNTISISATSSATSGNITVSAINSCGASAPQTLAVTVATTPAMPTGITGNTVICAGTSNTYSVPLVTGATSYTWSLPGSWTGTSTTNSISALAGNVGGNITVSASNTCGISPVQSLAVSVESAPSVPVTITGNDTVCAGSSNSYTIASVSGATDYTWTLPLGWSGSSTTSSITATAGNSSGNISVVANNACGSSASQAIAVSVITPPIVPSAIIGNAGVCVGSANTYFVPVVPGATSYTWSLPVGWTGASTADSIVVTASATGGVLNVMANNQCGSSASQALSIATIAVPSTPSNILGNASVCQGSENTYMVALDSNASSYTWALPSGWSGTSSTESITATAGGAGGNISVVANNACGTSSAQALVVNVLTVDTAVTQSGNILIAAAAATAYQWIDCATNAAIQGEVGQSFTASASGNYAVVLTQNGCIDTSSCYSMNVVGLMSDVTYTGFTIFPNPSNGLFQFWAHDLQNMDNAIVEVYTVRGESIYRAVVTTERSTIDLTSQAKGIYLLRIWDGERVWAKQIMIR